MIPALGAGLVRLRGEGMIAVPGRRRRRPGQGIRSLADVPTDRFAKVLHLCRYPDRCCKVCDRTDHDAATTAATTRHPSLADPGRPAMDAGSWPRWWRHR